jgi:diguanylate cyclase
MDKSGRLGRLGRLGQMEQLGLIDSGEFARRIEGWGEEPLSVAAVDIDHFKEVNDRFGHQVGDAVLSVVAGELRGAVGDGGWVTRRGGDEFHCALPLSSPEEALLDLEKVRRRLSEKRHRVESESLTIPISVGIAGYPHHVEEPAGLPGAAEEALDRAKREGRNRVVIYVEEKMVLKSNYYPRAQLGRLSSLAEGLGRTEASLLREALQEVLERHRDAM